MPRFTHNSTTSIRHRIPSLLLLVALAVWGGGCKMLDTLEPSNVVTDPPAPERPTSSTLTMTSYRGSITVTPYPSVGYRVTGTISVTLNQAISPAPSRVRAEWENSMVGGSVSYASLSNRTQFDVTVNQDTVACPNFSNSPADHLRLIDVDRQVVVTRGNWTWTGTVNCR